MDTKTQRLKNKKQKIIFLFLLATFEFFPLFSIAAGLVPCGGEGERPCQLCDIFTLFKNIIDTVVFKLVPVVAILMIAISGFLYIISYSGGGVFGGEGPGLISKARGILTTVVLGLILIFAAWLIVNLFFQLIGISEVGDFKSLPQNWWRINCPP